MNKIKKYKDEGYEIIRETKHLIVYKVPKHFNWGVFILLSIVFNIFGLIGYIIYYAMKASWIDVTLRKK